MVKGHTHRPWNIIESFPTIMYYIHQIIYIGVKILTWFNSYVMLEILSSSMRNV